MHASAPFTDSGDRNAVWDGHAIRIAWFEVLAAVGLAASSQTAYRYFGDFGVGDVIVAICALIGLVPWLYGGCRVSLTRGASQMVGILALYLVAIVLPLTVVHTAVGTIGSSFRTLAALGLCVAFLISLDRRATHLWTLCRWYAVALLVLLAYQYFVNHQVYGGIRLLIGANNPNQLGLYALCGVAVGVAVFKRPIALAATVAPLAAFGFMSESDTFRLALGVGVSAYVFAKIGGKYRVLLTTLVVLAAVSALMIAGPHVVGEYAKRMWLHADAGDAHGGRLTLFANGILAWLSSPVSAIVGNGAGSFSGFAGPFHNFEAHNTVIDMLSIGGLAGCVAAYYFPLRAAYRFYLRRQARYLAPLVAVICFSLFNFVGRQPVWWATLLLFVCIDDAWRTAAARAPARGIRCSDTGRWRRFVRPAFLGHSQRRYGARHS